MMAIVVASPALADESRNLAMAGLGLYFGDDTNQFLLPTTMSEYQNQAVVELQSRATPDAQQTAGATILLPKLEWNMGFYVNRPTPSYHRYPDYSVDPASGDTRLQLNREHLLMIGQGHWAAGVALGGDAFSVDTMPIGGLEEEKASNVSLIGGFETMMGQVETEIGGKFAFAKGEQKFDGTVDEGAPSDFEEQTWDFSALIRNHYDRGQNGKLVSLLTFGISQNELDPEDPSGATDQIAETNTWGFGTGLGWLYPVTNKTMAIMVIEPFGFGQAKTEMTFSGDDNTNKATITTIEYPSFFFALEAWITSWLQGRGGIGQVFTSVKTESETTVGGETDSNNFKDRMSDFATTFGFGIKLGDNWMVDGVFNDQYLFNGPDFITGSSDFLETLFTRVSVKGKW
jgi:hypothetical protein